MFKAGVGEEILLVIKLYLTIDGKVQLIDITDEQLSAIVAALASMFMHLAKNSYQFGVFVFNSLRKNQLNLKRRSLM